MKKDKLKKILFLSILVAGAIILNSTDIILTLYLPYFQIGLSHIVSLIILYMYGRKEMSFVVIFKVLLVSLIWGKLFSPVFFISLAGNFLVIIFYLIGKKHFNIIPLSIGGSFFNNIGQFLIVYCFFINNNRILIIFSIMMILGIVSGAIIGYIAKIILKKLKKEGIYDLSF